MNLDEHIAQLRQLASADPQTTTQDLAILNLLAELAQAVHIAQLIRADPKTSVLDPAIITTLAEHIVQLRQLASINPELNLLEVAIINVLAELAEAVEDLRGERPITRAGQCLGVPGRFPPRLGQPAQARSGGAGGPQAHVDPPATG